MLSPVTGHSGLLGQVPQPVFGGLVAQACPCLPGQRRILVAFPRVIARDIAGWAALPGSTGCDEKMPIYTSRGAFRGLALLF